MKTIILVTVILTSISLKDVLSQSYSLGGALIYGNDIEEFGGHARAYYNMKNNKICFGPEFSQFSKKKVTIGGEEISERLREVNFNLHYIFELNESWGFYPLVGLNMSFVNEEITDISSIHTETHKAEEFGTNLGFGFHKNVNRWMFFGEFDRLFSDISQNSFLVGAFFTFGKKTEHE
ncbi:MAG: hypothetical protein ACI9J3_003066 [Parvicellaceae bacterium]|jgi:hypothetical protein